jgi:SagB-type dehydrogenase family enzyme
VGDQASRAAATLESELAASRHSRPDEHARNVSWRDERDGVRLKLGGLVRDDSLRFSSVLGRRRSERDLAAPGLPGLATMLIRCHRVIEWEQGTDGYVMTHRPTPSAGARHPIDLHLLARDVEGLETGAWRFDALSCELVEAQAEHEETLQKLGKIVGGPVPPAALVAVAHLDRTLSRYPDGLSLLWRDAGALLATLHLCATDLGLASCIVGATGAMTYDLTSGEVDVGTLIVGSPPFTAR